MACGVVLVGDGGEIARVDYGYNSTVSLKGSWEWRNHIYTTVGPRIKSALEAALTEPESLTAENLQLIFGVTHGEVLGKSEARAEALHFIKQVDASGDDTWAPVSFRN